MLHQLPPFRVPVTGARLMFERLTLERRGSAWHTALLPLHHVTSMDMIALFETITLIFFFFFILECATRCFRCI